MGLSGLSFGHMLVVLLVVILVFGTRRLGSIGADLGEAIKSFRKAMASDEDGAKAVGDGGPASLEQGAVPRSVDAKAAPAPAGNPPSGPHPGTQA